MVVLSAGIVTRGGKALFATNFNKQMEKARIEGLLTAFPKLVNAGNQDSTYIETESVRYVYQTMENVFLLLITNKTSNILNDIETLNTLAKLVPEYTINHTLEEHDIIDSAMELYNAFSEVIDMGGYRAGVTTQQVKTFVSMESHEERIQQMIQANKEKETAAHAKQKAKQLREARIAAGGSSLAAGFGGISGMGGGPKVDTGLDSHGLPVGSRSSVADVGHHDYDRDRDRGGDRDYRSTHSPSPVGGGGGGMKLGHKPSATIDFVKGLKNDGAIDDVEAAQELSSPTPSSNPTHPNTSASASSHADPFFALPRVPKKPVHITLEENVSVVLDKDGGVSMMEVKGDLTLFLADQAPNNRLKIKIGAGENAGFQFKAHPLINKQMFSKQQVLTLKDPTKGFPLNTPLALVKWRYVAKNEDEGLVPLVVNCWPNMNPDGTTGVNIEYEAQLPSKMELRNVKIMIPVTSASEVSPPVINSADGQWEYNPVDSMLVWSIDVIDSSNTEGALDFKVPGAPDDSFFPVGIAFASAHNLCEVGVESVALAETGAPCDFSHEARLSAGAYRVE